MVDVGQAEDLAFAGILVTDLAARATSDALGARWIFAYRDLATTGRS